MPKFIVTVTEYLAVDYGEVEIDAEDEEEAKKIAEEMLVQGGLGEPIERVDDVDIEASLVSND